MRTFNIYSLSNFQIYSTFLTITTMLYNIFQRLILYMWIFIPLDYLHLCCPSPHPTSGNNQSFCVCVCVCVCVCCLIWLSLSIGPSMLLQMVKVYSFLWLHIIPQCVCVSHFSLFIHQWTFWLLLCFHYCINNATINMEMKISFQVSVFVFLG